VIVTASTSDALAAVATGTGVLADSVLAAGVFDAATFFTWTRAAGIFFVAGVIAAAVCAGVSTAVVVGSDG
jgi:hypothetical protein